MECRLLPLQAAELPSYTPPPLPPDFEAAVVAYLARRGEDGFTFPNIYGSAAPCRT